jgi:hypothetical protein
MHTYVNIPEVFFHYIWRHKLLKNELRTGEGEKIEILYNGIHNNDSGPDFLCARIRIGKTVWAGNVEIHVRASDWYRHKHHKDAAYNSVILHVVGEDDMPVRDSSGRKLPSLCLSDAYDKNLLHRYRDISQNMLWVPCQELIKGVDKIHITGRINAEAIQRLYNKSDAIRQELALLQNDWEECCYRFISRQFGAKVNVPAFEMLSKTLTVRILMKERGELVRTEALLFGQSGLLKMRIRGRYPHELKKEHAFLAAKHNLSPMPGYLWKFMRMRPAAFPTIRIAYLAALYSQHQSLFQEIIERDSLERISSLFKVCASTYWDDHFVFDRRSRKQTKTLGIHSIRILLINAIIPLIHLYGQEMNKPGLCDRAVAFLEGLPPENNAIVRRWSTLGIKPLNSLESQGLIQLKHQMCDRRMCLECSIGHKILQISS